MKFRHLIILLFAFTICSCTDNSPKEHLYKKHLGIYVDRGMRQGQYHMDKNGNKYNYRCVTTTITNDTIIPIQIKISLSNIYNYPPPFSDQKFKVFLLPETMTAEKQYEDDVLNKFLDRETENSFILNKIINPKEQYDLTIGILTSINYNDPGQLALITKDHKPHFFGNDSLINQAVSKNKSLDLSLVLDFFQFSNTDHSKYYSIIPCGQISFLE